MFVLSSTLMSLIIPDLLNMASLVTLSKVKLFFCDTVLCFWDRFFLGVNLSKCFFEQVLEVLEKLFSLLFFLRQTIAELSTRKHVRDLYVLLPLETNPVSSAVHYFHLHRERMRKKALFLSSFFFLPALCAKIWEFENRLFRMRNGARISWPSFPGPRRSGRRAPSQLSSGSERDLK